MKFRPRSILTLAPEKRASYLAQLPTVTDAIAARALVNYHLERQRPMMGAFLDLLGIAHENGLISEENLPKPDAAKVKQAAKDLAAKYPADDVRSTSRRSSRRIPRRGSAPESSLGDAELRSPPRRAARIRPRRSCSPAT